MRLHDCMTAPSARRARMFIAEKGMSLETVQVDLRGGEHLSEAFREKNPCCTVPVLELDDGTWIAENVAIARYLEEVRPDPPLLGRDAKDKALVTAWNARTELEGFYAVAEYFRNSAEGFVDRAVTGPINYAQIPALAERGRARFARFLEMLDAHLADGRAFIVGDAISLADITALVTVDFGERVKLPVPAAHVHLGRWRTAVAARASASA